MRRVQSGPLALGCAVLTLVAMLHVTVRLPAEALLVGVGCALAAPLALLLGQRRYGVDRLGPADWVTLGRATLTCGVLVAAVGDRPTSVLAALLVPALALDWVDGRVARASGTASELGARLDMEVDALLILVLSWHVATDVGWWVLGLGLARYLFAAVVWLTPPLQHEPPPRPWCKTVAVLVALVLAAAVLEVLPAAVELLYLVVVSLLLAESFAHEALDRWRAGTGRVPVAVGGSRG